MKIKLLPLIALALIIFSCKDVEEPSPNSQIEGVFLSSYEGNNAWINKKFNFVDLMKFNSNGTVTGESYTTELNSDEILGYRGYFSGSYSIKEGKVIVSYGELFHLGIEDVNYLPKEDLVLSEPTDFTSEYGIEEDYSELVTICSIYSICNGTSSYVRVE
ncbi:hypothetical protein SAMN04489724_3131 [Algoriphagus locisalis]|uniref:Uncharacterized protein n=1 Tax=Algoriphagus locisalis TaxID=305507 RepID=A0A1I7CF35_9BACT|nr:hypothetical protein [Algoriphagus locisalis]SFT98036.1 hypothetical protein SAMN04489724_3131 [Algoriphagus locisalis]